jgi:hypothetical protein
MPVPTSIDDLALAAGSNFPSGSESPNTCDNYLRAHASFIAELRDADDGHASTAALAASTGSSLIGHIQTGTGAVARTLQAKLRDIVSVKDFGAVGDGVTDDTAAIQAAIVAHRNGEIVWFPDGTYLTSGIIVYSNNHLSFSPGAELKMSANNAVVVRTRNLVGQDYVSNACQRIRIDNLEIDMNSKSGFGLLLEGCTHAHIEKPRIYNVGVGSFTYDDGCASTSYNTAAIVLKGVYHPSISAQRQGCYYNRVQRAQCTSNVRNANNGFYLGTTATQTDSRANFNAIIQPVCTGFENGISLNMAGDNYVEMPELTNNTYAIRVGRDSGSTKSRRNHIKMPYMEGITDEDPPVTTDYGIYLTSNALDTVIDGVGSTGVDNILTDNGSNTAYFAANSDSVATAGFARFYKGGVVFPTLVDGTDPDTNQNALDAYKEGMSTNATGFTPAIVSSTGGSGTYTTQAGDYTVIGNRCFFNLTLVWTAHTGSGGNLNNISGLPFTCDDGVRLYPASIYRVDAFSLTAGHQLQAAVSSNSTLIAVTSVATGGGAATTVTVPASGALHISGHYIIKR